MALELIYNTSEKPLFVNYDGRSLIVQPKDAGTYKYERFGVTEQEASVKEIDAGLFFEDADSGRRLAVVPRAKYRPADYPKVVYGSHPDHQITKRLPRYCQIPVRVSDEPQDGCVEVPSTIANYACSAEFERRFGLRCYRGSEIAKKLRIENAELQARNANLSALEAKVAELEAKLAAKPKKANQE